MFFFLLVNITIIYNNFILYCPGNLKYDIINIYYYEYVWVSHTSMGDDDRPAFTIPIGRVATGRGGF